MNILIVKLSAIGDVTHTLPSLAGLRNMYPDAHITWVIEEVSADLVITHPFLDKVLISRRKRWVRDLKKFNNVRKTLEEIQSFIKTLRNRKYDLVIDFHGLFKSAVFVFLSRGKRKLGYYSMQEMSGLFLNERIHEDMGKHAVDRYLDFLRYLGSDIKSPEFLIPIKHENRKKIQNLLQANNIDIQEPFVSVNILALWDTKLWENEKFARLCDRIINELKVKVVFTGSSRQGALKNVQSLMEYPSVNFGGRTTLTDLAYVYNLSRLVISTDSGPMHIAAAMGTPTVALFGPTDPSRTGPYGEGHCIIRKELECSPCFLKKCHTKRCMKEITVDEVFEAVRQKIKGVVP